MSDTTSIPPARTEKHAVLAVHAFSDALQEYQAALADTLTSVAYHYTDAALAVALVSKLDARDKAHRALDRLLDDVADHAFSVTEGADGVARLEVRLA